MKKKTKREDTYKFLAINLPPEGVRISEVIEALNDFESEHGDCSLIDIDKRYANPWKDFYPHLCFLFELPTKEENAK